MTFRPEKRRLASLERLENRPALCWHSVLVGKTVNLAVMERFLSVLMAILEKSQEHEKDLT